MRAGDEPTEFLDFASLLSAPIKGELPLLVGGHAVNVWAWFYRNRIGKVLDDWLPLTSKDLDLVGTVALLEITGLTSHPSGRESCWRRRKINVS